MTQAAVKAIKEQPKFSNIKEPKNKIPLEAPAMYGDEIKYVTEAVMGAQAGAEHIFIERAEEEIARYINVSYAVALNSCTAALHLALKLAAEKLYGSATGLVTPKGVGIGGCLKGKKVFCPDFAPSEIANTVLYEDGEPVFVDACEEDWGMDPEVLEMAFERFPDVKIVIFSHIYGFPGQVAEVKKICEKYGALLIEDASGCLGACAAGKKTGSFGDYGIIGFESDGAVTGYSGGFLLTEDKYSSQKAKYWATGAHANAPWPQHEELGYRYRMENVAAALFCARFSHLDDYIGKKKEIFERYQGGFDEDLLMMNPTNEGTEPSYQTPCVMVTSAISFEETRSEREYTYQPVHGTASPMEIIETLAAFGIQSAPVWKPMHMQPCFANFEQITLDGCRRTYQDFYADDYWIRSNESKYLFEKGLRLPAGCTLTEEEQEQVMEIIRRCFD